MRVYLRLLPLSLFVLFATQLHAQDKSTVKFGKISPADFNLPDLKFDSGANAVVIADIGNTSFEGNNQGFFTLVFTRFIRVKIINKNGFDIGNWQLPIYHNGKGDQEKLSTLKGSTFNLENGNVTETKLDDKSVFTEKYSDQINLVKFSMPALKAGAIFDLTFTIRSPFDERLRPWSFQDTYPRLWSEYELTIPPCYHYVMNLRGDRQFYINTTKEIMRTYSIRQDAGPGFEAQEHYSLSGPALYQRWVKTNVPALHKEPFMTTIDNYNSQVSFQLNYFQWTDRSERFDHLETWDKLSKDLLEDENFGLELGREYGWMTDELKPLRDASRNTEELVYNIFCYVRDNYRVTGDGIYAHNSLKSVYKARSGNVAEINLLLTAMLRSVAIDASPAILSTRGNGVANPSYPMVGEYNYVICIVKNGGKTIKLDASEPLNGFGRLPVKCYNGWAHVISTGDPVAIPVMADSVHENSMVNVIIMSDEKGSTGGSYNNLLGISDSYDVRDEIRESSVKEYEKKIQTSVGTDVAIENFGIDSLKKYEHPLRVHYEFDLKNIQGDVIYFSPVLGESYKTNPFKAVERLYPVEIPYLIDETYLLNMDIPNGYAIDELPKSAKVGYNGNEGLFEYLVQKGDGNLQMKVHLKLNKTFFPVEEYPTLRDFFAFVVKKESEQIIFKKVK